MYLGEVFNAIFLFAYFGFLHLSNIAPESVALFNASRYLAGGDIICTPQFVKVIIKWTKTIQYRLGFTSSLFPGCKLITYVLIRLPKQYFVYPNQVIMGGSIKVLP